MRFASPLLSFAVASFAASGCRKHHHEGPPRYEQSCTTACERVAACDASVDAEACEEDCRDTFDPYGAHLRKEYLEEFDQCVADTRCRDLGMSALDNSCRNDAKERVGANLKAIKLCDAVSDTLARCAGSNQQNQTACLESMKIFNDATLAEATACGEVPCPEIGKCFTAALGYVPTNQAAGPHDAQE
jgi:hypothetical protein